MTETDPIVTVVMVAYNHGKYLRRTMESVFAQTLPELEVILVDNGSTDDTTQIIAQISDPRMQVIRQENLGLSLGYNIGIERARGKYIALGNADDEWMPEKLSKQLEAMKQRSAGASFTAARLIDDDGLPVPDEIARQHPFSFEDLPRHQMYEKFFFKTNFICATSALIERHLIAAEGFDPTLIQLQDFELWVRLVKETEFVVVPEKLVAYRVRSDGQNLSLDTRNRARVLFELHLVYRRFFERVDPSFFKQAFAQHFRKADQSNELGLEFEKAFLYLKMEEPSIRALGIELLYSLLSLPAARGIAEADYNLKIADLWDISKTAIYADSQSMEASALDGLETAQRLKDCESELERLRESMRQITSGKLWKLREKVYDIFK